MSVQKVVSPIDVAVSGMRAQSLRMNVTANKIANSNTSRAAGGQPYRRQRVLTTAGAGISGVQIVGVRGDYATDFKKVLDAGNPDADENGFVNMPNVDLPIEMMQMVIAGRGYQANAAVLKKYQDMVDVALEVIR